MEMAVCRCAEQAKGGSECQKVMERDHRDKGPEVVGAWGPVLQVRDRSRIKERRPAWAVSLVKVRVAVKVAVARADVAETGRRLSNRHD